MKHPIPLKWPLAFLALLPCLASALFGADGSRQPLAAGACLVYVGTYTNSRSQGIYAWRMDTAGGSLSSLGLAVQTPNPSFLEVAPNHRFLYAVNELDTFEGKPAGSVSAFSIDAATGKLTFLNRQTSGGASPCHLTLDAQGKNVLVANYTGGSTERLPVQSDGRLGAPTDFQQHIGKSVNPDRQLGPHAHCVTLDDSNHFLFVCDLGMDKVLSFRFDASQDTLIPNHPEGIQSNPSFTTTQPGTGPRHLVFHPNGRHAYIINELNSTIVHYAYDPDRGVLKELQTVPLLAQSFTNRSTAAEIAVHPSGKFLYGSNRGEDTIVVFGIAATTGDLTFLQRVPTQGKTPRNFAIDPSGKFLFVANQNSDNIVIFNIDPATGKLTPSGKVLDAPSPVCVKFVPAPLPAASR
ncbi:MAG: lactonase family protein [Verrucomicrobiota bacterium]